MKLIKPYEKFTYLYITLHKRVPNSRNLNQCTKVYRCLPAVVEHILGRCVVSIIILICPKTKDFLKYSVLRTSAESVLSKLPTRKAQTLMASLVNSNNHFKYSTNSSQTLPLKKDREKTLRN